ncbi:hypothetical protein Turpa_2259 [Turneriella parva DSM 21527]|uniref:Uncharacterized protein n=1 Tax=Turneriella parva (strain ATCC BAA-1111 / DSM 21527 / NCTC 11395 / H) TaxID=869212 RepID=I4B6J7_TURPD|nr:hypothetical protein Turpa_2259 [Turneriella parva DSM 21527]
MKVIFLFVPLAFSGLLAAEPDSSAVERLRRQYGCSSLRAATLVAERSPGRPALYACYRGRELAHQKLSYIEISDESAREFMTLESFAARFAPFNDGAAATALAMAFTNAEPALGAVDGALFSRVAPPGNTPAVAPSGAGHRVRLYEYAPQQGHCEVPGYYEIVVQTWPDGLKRQIRKVKVYERSDKQQICVD